MLPTICVVFDRKVCICCVKYFFGRHEMQNRPNPVYVDPRSPGILIGLPLALCNFNNIRPDARRAILGLRQLSVTKVSNHLAYSVYLALIAPMNINLWTFHELTRLYAYKKASLEDVGLLLMLDKVFTINPRENNAQIKFVGRPTPTLQQMNFTQDAKNMFLTNMGSPTKPIWGLTI